MGTGPLPENLLLPLTQNKDVNTPMPAKPTQNHKPVLYCLMALWPLATSTAWTTAEARARPTPEPIWNAVLICNSLARDLRTAPSAYHSTAEGFDIVWHRGQQDDGAGAVYDCHPGYDEKTCRKNMFPARTRKKDSSASLIYYT
jgi:hypothetical protein